MADKQPVPISEIPAEVLNEFLDRLPDPGFHGKGTGARFQEEDRRDHLLSDKLEEVEADVPTLPKVKDLRPKMPEIYDQGHRGSCTAQTACGCDEATRIRLKMRPVRLSRLMNYFMSREHYGEIDQDLGATNRQAFKNLATGVAPESMWPHDLSKWKQRPPQEAWDAGKNYQAIEYLSIPNTNKEEANRLIKLSLARGYPVGFAMLIHENFEPNWQSRIPFPQGQIEGGHAMMIVGYSEYSKTWIIRNSWGTGWGGTRVAGGKYVWGGYARIGFDHLDAFGRDYWVLRLSETQ